MVMRSSITGSQVMTTPHERLKQRAAVFLDSSLGLDTRPGSFISVLVFGSPAAFRNNPYLGGVRMGMLYALLFCVIPWIILQKPSLPLFFLQIYGSFWSAWATTTTRITSSSISETINNNIIPYLSARTAENIYNELTERFERKRMMCVSGGIAIFGAALAGYLIDRDIKSMFGSSPPIYEIVWWSIGWAILFSTATSVVNVSRFYRIFAAHVEDDAAMLFPIDPARSTLVISVASVAQRMLLFWFGIAISIGLVIPFGVKDWSVLSLSSRLLFDPSNNLFVIFDVLITGFFSIGFGTIIFLRSEAALRRAVKKVTLSTLRVAEKEVAELSIRLGELDEANWKKLTQLSSLHNEVATAGSYRSLILSGLSVFVPFVIPLLSLFFHK
jgi:hypothetical protein